MRSVLLGNDFIQTATGQFKFLETNTNTTFEHGFETYTDFGNVIDWMKSNGATKLILIGNVDLVSNHMSSLCEVEGFEYQYYKVSEKNPAIPDIGDADDILILRIAYDYTALVDTEYAADKKAFYDLISEEDFAIKTYFKGNTITQFVESYNNFPNYVVKGRVPNLSLQTYPKYYKLNTIEDVQGLINGLDGDTEMVTEFILSSAQIDNQLCTIRSLDLLFADLKTFNIGTYYKSMYFSKEEIGEFEYDESGELHPKYRYALTNDLQPSEMYSGDNTDELIIENGSNIAYSDIQKGMSVQTISISDLPSDELPNILGVPVTTKNYLDWNSTPSELIANTSKSTALINSYEYLVQSTWMRRITLDNGFQWEDSFETKMIVQKANSVAFESVKDWNVGDIIWMWDNELNQYITHTITELELVWIDNKILYIIDVNPDDVYLTTAYGNVVFVQHNLPCSCCDSAFCGSTCCGWICSGCGKV